MRLVAFGLLASLTTIAACSGGAAGASSGSASADVARPEHTIVLVDVSASQTPGALADGRKLLDTYAQGQRFGDALTILEMHREGVRETLHRWSGVAPRPERHDFVSSVDEEKLQEFRERASNQIPVFFDTRGASVSHTDILSTIQLASQYFLDSRQPGRKLVLLSDMLQSASGMEMEGMRRMPPPDWVAAQKRQGTLPDLHGVCVVVVGADPTTPAGQAVKKFWTDYFTAAGAVLLSNNYRLVATDLGELGCN